MINILWIAPNLNHYKSRFLNRLVEMSEIKLTVFAGSQDLKLGHRPDESNISFSKLSSRATKQNFNYHPEVYRELYRIISAERFNSVSVPVEKKFFLVIFYLFLLKIFFRFKLISYSHPVTRESVFGPENDMFMTKLFFSLFDQIIFYTKEAMEWAISSKIIPQKKASYANNTLDTASIWRNYDFEVNDSDKKVILFIGRLVKRKRLDILLSYHRGLRKVLPSLQLVIIGDGPESDRLKLSTKNDESISLRGAVVDEVEIADIMRTAHIIFVPGASGLSIVHAFCYGKPYATIAGSHGPEIAYLKDSQNGLILSGDMTKDCSRIASFLNDPKTYERACHAAFNKAKELSIENWCIQMVKAICK